MWRVFSCPLADVTTPYTKPAISYEDQAQRLIQRGLIVDDRSILVDHLRDVGYDRLRAYWLPFEDRTSADGRFLPETRFDVVWERYLFDRQFRLVVVDAIEQVRIAVRTALVHELTMRAGPFGHRDAANFRKAASRPDRNGRVRHAEFLAAHEGVPNLPIWAACEHMTFGNVLTLFNMSEARVQKAIARPFHLPAPLLYSWLHTLNYVGNICAHHARLWNRDLAVRPAIPEPRNDARWHWPIPISNRKVFVVLTLLHYLLQDAAPRTQWRDGLFALFAEYPQIPLRMMGIPADWKAHDLWL